MALKTKSFDIDGETLFKLAALGVVYFGVVNPIFKKTGLKPSAEDKYLTNAKNANGWDPFFYQQNQGKGFLKLQYPELLAKTINQAWGIFNDDEDAIYSVFRSIQSQFMLSQVSASYINLFKKDLLSRLRDGLSSSEFKKIAEMVAALPDFTKP